MAQTPAFDLPLFCERCGYMLQGLSPQRCSACSLFALRCPECGHQQHANSIRPALLRILGRLRGASHVLGSLLVAGFCGLAGFIWWVVGLDSANAIRNGRVPSSGDYPLFILAIVVSSWSLYAILAHARSRFVPVLLVLIFHVLACFVGLHSNLGRNFGGVPRPMPLLPEVFLLYLLPWFVMGAISGWAVLRMFYFAFWPARVQALLLAWLCHGRMPRLNLHAITPPAHLPFGEDLPHFCDGCGKPLPTQRPWVCPQCTLMQIRCGDCDHVQPVSPLRPILRESIARAFATVLHLLTLLQGGIILAALFGWLVGGHECAYTYRYVPVPSLRVIGTSYAGPYPIQWNSEEAFVAVLCAVLFGIVTRTMLLRWKSGLLVGLVVGLVAAGTFAFGMALRSYARSEAVSPFSGGSALVLAMIGVGVLAGSLLTWPGWWLFMKVMLPRAIGNRLLHWLTTGSLAELIVLDGQRTDVQRDTEPVGAPA
jgi:hypothetical protein